MKDTKLVYTDDPKLAQKCPKCKNFLKECSCIKDEPVKNYTAILRIEKSGRGGKTVTVIDKLPRNEPYIKELAKTLKTKLGVGGTYKLDETSGIIELQGDKREQLREIFKKMCIAFKG